MAYEQQSAGIIEAIIGSRSEARMILIKFVKAFHVE